MPQAHKLARHATSAARHAFGNNKLLAIYVISYIRRLQTFSIEKCPRLKLTSAAGIKVLRTFHSVLHCSAD